MGNERQETAFTGILKTDLFRYTGYKVSAVEGNAMQYGHFDKESREYVIDRVDLPAGWKEFSAVRRWRGAEYRIHVTNPHGVEKGVAALIWKSTCLFCVVVLYCK